MSKKKITIRMPKAMLSLWLKTLRLPANQKLQGTGALFSQADDDYDTRGYCCLGALQCAVTGGKVASGGFPAESWLQANSIEFFDKNGNPANAPYFPSCRATADQANDKQRKTFKQIADAIEKCAVGY